MKKKMAIIMSVILLPLLFSGCTSLSGAKVAQAIAKSTDWKSVEINQEISATLNYDNPKASGYTFEDAKDFSNLVNNSKLSLTSKVDLSNNRVSVKYLFAQNMLSLNDTVYFDKEKIWVKEQPMIDSYYDNNVIYKIPINNRYIEIDLKQLFPNAKDKFNSSTQERLKTLTLKFIKDYVSEYKNKFENIKDTGTTQVKTGTGTKNIKNMEIVLNDKETYKLMKYTLDNFADNKITRNYCMDVLSNYIQSVNPSKIESFNAEDIEDQAKSDIDSAREYIKENSDKIIKEFLEGINIDSKAVVINVGIDEEGNLHNIDLSVKFCVEDVDGESGKLNVEINVKSKFSNINSTTVEIPQFNKRNTMSFKNYVATHYELKDSVIGDLLGIRPKPQIWTPAPIIQNDKTTIHFTIGTAYSYTNQNYADSYLKIAPYIEGDTGMVQGRYLGENLNCKVDYDAKNNILTFKEIDDNTTIKVKLGSTTAYINDKKAEMPVSPIMLGGEVIVPVRFISENLGATINYENEYNWIRFTVEKPKKVK